MVGHFYVRPSNRDVGRPAGSGRLVWVEEEAVMPSQPVLQTAGVERQLCKISWTEWKAGVDVDIVCALVEVNSRVTDQSTDRCHVRGEQHGPQYRTLWDTEVGIDRLGCCRVDAYWRWTFRQVGCDPLQTGRLPVTPKSLWSRSISVLWQTASNADDISRPTTATAWRLTLFACT